MLGTVFISSSNVSAPQIQKDKEKGSSVGISVTLGAFFSELQRSVHYRNLFSKSSCTLVYSFYYQEYQDS